MNNPSKIRQFFTATAIAIATLLVGAVCSEMLIRVKNSDQHNYVVEMWRYSNELKELSPDIMVGHTHKPNSKARLQNVDFRINSLGLRGKEPTHNDSQEKILLLGSSIVLGWGVPEEQTIQGELQKKLGERFDIHNGGIGNFNANRSVRLYETSLRTRIKPDVIVYGFFLRDGEHLTPDKVNPIFKYSQLAVLLFHMYDKLTHGTASANSIIDHYNNVYDNESKDFAELNQAFMKLSQMTKEDGTRVIIAMIPDIHQLQPYPFNSIHDKIKSLADKFGFEFVDTYEGLKEFKGPELWTIPGDPHPNGIAHEIMASRIAQEFK